VFDTHALEHKKISKSKQVALDAMGCDGSGNYLKATQTCDGGWQVEDFAARSYGRRSKEAIQEWLVRTYSNDTLTELAPVAEDTELLAFTKAAQQARAVLKGGVEVAFFPLGLERRKVMNYRALKASGFLFNRPEQRAAIVKAWVKFEGKSGAGLEALALRRSYGGRRQGSLEDLAEELYRLIRNDEDNLTKLLNLNKLSQTVLSATSPRSTQIKQRKAEIDQAFWETIDATNLVPEALPTAYLVTAAEIELIKGDEDSLPLQTTPTDAGLASWPPWPGTEKVGAV